MGYTRLLATIAIFGALLSTTIWALGDVIAKQNADAQMMGPNNPRMATTAGNMTSGMFMKPGQNITSSINLMNIIHQAIGSKVNVSLSEAATTAESSVGNNSHAVAAQLGEHNGYLVYNVMVIDPSMNFSKVIVDPGNGKILSSKQISKEEHMMMHRMGKQSMMGPGMIMGHERGGGMMMGPMDQEMMMRGGEVGGGRDMAMGPGMIMGHERGGGMMMGPMLAQSQQTGNATSTNATSTRSTTNATSTAAVSASGLGTATVSMAQGAQSPSNPEFFVPAEITVKPGETITWKNDDTAIHTATSGQDATPDGKFDTSFVPPRQSSKPITMPTQPGQYPYFCTLHPWMTGTVTVG